MQNSYNHWNRQQSISWFVLRHILHLLMNLLIYIVVAVQRCWLLTVPSAHVAYDLEFHCSLLILLAENCCLLSFLSTLLLNNLYCYRTNFKCNSISELNCYARYTSISILISPSQAIICEICKCFTWIYLDLQKLCGWYLELPQQ